MSNQFGIPEEKLNKIRLRDKNCVYCGKLMIKPKLGYRRSQWATIEHFNYNGPFYWKDGLKLEDIAICHQSCNASRGRKKLMDWFKSDFCKARNINERTVATPVKKYLRLHAGR